MLKFTLMKNLYYELDPEKMDGVKEIYSGDAHYRILPVSFPEIEEIYSMTIQERYFPYATMYYIYVNSERYPSEITETRVKKLLIAFYSKYFPAYFVDGIGDTIDEIVRTDDQKAWERLDLLNCLDPDKMPGYQQKYAYKEILTVEDLRKGKTGDEHKPKASFPGMVFSDKYRPQ